MSKMTLKILHQDAIKATVDYWPRSKKLIAYKHLNALGCKLDGMDYEIDKEVKKELEQGIIDLKHAEATLTPRNIESVDSQLDEFTVLGA